MSIIAKIKRIPIIGHVYKLSILPRSKIKFHRIQSMIVASHKILDIGCGNGGVLHLLIQKGFNASGIDISDQNFYPDNKVDLYDGNILPYPDQAYNCGLILTVLHHTPNPEALIIEAGRVCKELIIIEDIVTGYWNKKLMYFMDSLINFEWKGHPHSNKTDAEWVSFFKKQGFNIVMKQEHTLLFIFKQITYRLRK